MCVYVCVCVCICIYLSNLSQTHSIVEDNHELLIVLLPLSQSYIIGIYCHRQLVQCWDQTQGFARTSQAFYQLSYIPRPQGLFEVQDHLTPVTQYNLLQTPA